MVKLPELNRHMVGLSAIAVAILGLSYGADVINANYIRPVARLADSGAAGVQQTATNTQWRAPADTAGSNAATTEGSKADFLSMLNQIPPNAYGWAAGGREQPAKPQEKAAVSPPASALDSLAAESKNWNEQDWRLAVQAVTNGRAKSQNTAQNSAMNSAMSGVVWAPPEEIAKKGASPAR